MRWYIKKAARLGVAMGSAASGSLVLRRLFGDRARIRTLTYHRIGQSIRDPFCVATADFEAQVRQLAESGRAVSLEQLVAFVQGGAEMPSDACLITIDDGMISTLTEALPILERWKVPAVAFVTSSLIGKNFEGSSERYMTWDELRQLAASGLVAIGSHAHTHRSLGLMSPDEAVHEARQSREMLSQQLGQDITVFAYPFGTRSDFNDTTERLLRDAGYTLAFNSVHGAIVPGMDLISLPRIKIEGGESLRMFSLASRGAMDAWKVVDQTLWRLQRVRQEIT
jgi:peptidoglycan/xylan/chitin deacetylase (PgdA/CDA1 family)